METLNTVIRELQYECNLRSIIFASCKNRSMSQLIRRDVVSDEEPNHRELKDYSVQVQVPVLDQTKRNGVKNSNTKNL